MGDATASALLHSPESPCSCNGPTSSRNTHPDILAQVEATDEDNKRKLLKKNEVDILSIKQKMQHEEGRIKALEYFEVFSKEEKLTWVENIFDDVKGRG